MYLVINLFFFFSSRRRHTRFDCDWSSDVCSSDLDLSDDLETEEDVQENTDEHDDLERAVVRGRQKIGVEREQQERGDLAQRSEERRVGKECRSRWSPYH